MASMTCEVADAMRFGHFIPNPQNETLVSWTLDMLRYNLSDYGLDGIDGRAASLAALAVRQLAEGPLNPALSIRRVGVAEDIRERTISLTRAVMSSIPPVLVSDIELDEYVLARHLHSIPSVDRFNRERVLAITSQRIVRNGKWPDTALRASRILLEQLFPELVEA